jgi:hypothetical protein
MAVIQVAGGQATILGWGEGPRPRGADTASLLAACQEVLPGIEAMAEQYVEGPCVADQGVVGVPQSQLRAGSWSVTQRRPTPGEAVDERELGALLDRSLRLAVQALLSVERRPDAEGRTRAVSSPKRDRGWVLVDAAAVMMTVEGRRVTDLVGFCGAQIGATVFAALAEASTVETWRLIGKSLGFSALTLVPLPLVLTAGLPDMEGILLDIGGMTTDLILWHAGRPVTVDSVAVGGDSVTATLVDRWRLAPERAEQVKQMYASGQLEEDACAQVREVMLPAVRLWLEKTEGALALMNRDGLLPEHLYLLGGGAVLPEMMEATRALAWSERLRFSRYPQVRHFQPTDLPGLVNPTGQPLGAGDLSLLALSAWAARRTHSQDRPGRLLDHLCAKYQRDWS